LLESLRRGGGMAGQTRGAIGLSLIFCFFCIKAKEKAKSKK